MDPFPDASARPYYEYLANVKASFATFGDLIKISAQARREWREAQEAALNLRNVKHPSELTGYIGTMHRTRPIAYLYAVPVLVRCHADVEDLCLSVGVPRKSNVHFGPMTNGVPFTQLLQAGANATRHGAEWWSRVVASLYEWVESESPHRQPPTPRFDKNQRRSIEPLVKALGITDMSQVNEWVAADVLLALSNGNAKTLCRRMFRVAAEIAAMPGQSVDALQDARVRLAVPDEMFAIDD